MENDASFGENMDEDNTNIEMLLNISYCFKTFRVIMIIINISYFIGMFWLSFIDIVDAYQFDGYDELNHCEEN